MSYEELCMRSVQLVEAVGHYVYEESQKLWLQDAKIKDNESLVTVADQKAEDQLVAGLQKILPKSGFLTEEGTEDTKGETYRWIIDPIDGTTNFVYGIPVFAISVGLMEEDDLVAGIIYEVNRKEMFYTWKGGGAFMNKRKIEVSKNTVFKDALLATGFPHRNEYTEKYVQMFREFMVNTRGVRRLGSAAVDLAYVAAGRFDGFYEHNLNPWDVAAGILLVKEAGGRVSDFKGGEDYLYGGEIIAANALHQQIQQVVEQIFFLSNK